ncbi:MAG TPA: M14 family zinc carboxypeptidase [Bacteroidia bacterium]|nr:M14 family zinc carboxypeptidase [Bacteroidia bacterium]HMU20484.1 M14 family zinc carboxypeptidase [Bacteroidia bacterium]
MKSIITIVLALLVSVNVFAQAEKYQKVRIWLDGKAVSSLAQSGVDLSEAHYRKGLYYETDLNTSELNRISTAGFRTEVLIDDVKQFYKQRNEQQTQKTLSAVTSCSTAPDYPQPAHFGYGSMGGFFTYQQLLDNLDSMAILYPNLITFKQPISNTQTTIEGRPIFYVKISDNPNLAEPEPEVLYTALHHCREPNGMAAVIYYMWYLLENYATNTDIQQLVNNTEMYFVPCVNPDGYVFNEMNDPNGGGMWRKNRQPFPGGEFGVDLNRNYGVQWGYDDIGSSPDPADDTYRGPSAFSENETQMMSAFCQQHNFKLALNYHTYSNLLIYPWGYIPDYYTPDSALYKNYGDILTTYNKYAAGTANQTVGYMVNGSSDDWMYGEQTLKPKTFAMTPEIGSADDGFWPQQSRIVDLCKENMYANLMLARLAGKFGQAVDKSRWNISALTSYIPFDFKLLGLDTVGTFTVSLTPISSNIQTTGTAKTFSGLNFNLSVSDSINITLNSTTLPGDELKFLLTVNNGLYDISDTIIKYYGPAVTPFYENGSTTSAWNTQFWGTATSSFVSAPSSIADSPVGDYQSSSNNAITTISSINLLNAAAARLSFFAKWATEPQYDFAQLLISDNNGSTWTPLCGKYTVPGSNFQDPGNPVYQGVNLDWVKEDINLNAYVGKNVKLKFIMVSDGFVEYDGFYVDDLSLEKIVASGVGINNLENNTFNMYPNPATDLVRIETGGNAENIFVVNALGQLVFTGILNAKQQYYDLNSADFAAGVYVVKIKYRSGAVAQNRLMVYKK